MDTPILSLYELNNLVRGVLDQTFCEKFWIRAETSDVRVSQTGHCYLEFIEKDEDNRTILAKARGSIWANMFRLLKSYFESETGQTFSSGLKVLVQVSVEFHEVYGYSLTVHNIDPSYTLGDQARKRSMILKQLEEEGVLTLNKELELPVLTNRIAVISSPTAAGYEDFCNQLESNDNGFVFYTHLFPAVMQGEQTENSVIAALDRIYEYLDKFDAVVIIRGGGATSELSSFDSYLLAANCAQFPLPIITGIGHERDDTVLDIVAHTRAKTPTAVAEFLIKKMQGVGLELDDIQEDIIFRIEKVMADKALLLESLSSRFSYITKDMTKDQLNMLASLSERLKNSVKINLTEKAVSFEMLSKRFIYSLKDITKDQFAELDTYADRLKSTSLHWIREQENMLAVKEQYLELVSPQTILKRGYTLTMKGDTIVKSSKEISKGDKLTTRFYDGDIDVEAR